VGHSNSEQLFVEPLGSWIPSAVLRICSHPDKGRAMQRIDPQRSGMLPRRLRIRKNLLEKLILPIHLVKVDPRVYGCDAGKNLGVTESDAEGSLTSHADSDQP
jgi:hypothetical protein